MADDVIWILDRIKNLDSSINRITDYRSIWQGSYDVILCEQDRIDNIEIPRRRFQEVVDLGFIRSEILHKQGRDKVYQIEVWKLTEDGERYLKENSCLESPRIEPS